ncbi:MAG: competence protein ComEA helix-hairpin-helix repeat protein [Myxococcales bacterium]|nr:competence protein ComEA helix-hairpin-helix repeat protein [Myxococcales bacterium]
MNSISKLISKGGRHVATCVALVLLVAAMGGSWTLRAASAAPPGAAVAAKPMLDDQGGRPPKKSAHKDLAGKLNLNTATEEQLMMLPSVGPAKAERIVAWRKKNGGFKRVADLRRVKGFGYKTFKRLEPFLDIKGDTNLADK